MCCFFFLCVQLCINYSACVTRRSTADIRHIYVYVYAIGTLLYRETRGYFSCYKHMHLKRECLWVLCAEYTHLVNICDFFINKCKYICMNSNVNTKAYWWFKIQAKLIHRKIPRRYLCNSHIPQLFHWIWNRFAQNELGLKLHTFSFFFLLNFYFCGNNMNRMLNVEFEFQLNARATSIR